MPPAQSVQFTELELFNPAHSEANSHPVPLVEHYLQFVLMEKAKAEMCESTMSLLSKMMMIGDLREL